MKESLEKAQLPGPLTTILMEMDTRLIALEQRNPSGNGTSESANHPCKCETCYNNKTLLIEQVVRQTERRIFQELADAASRFNLGNEADRLASAYLEHTGRGITTDSLLVEA